MTRLLIALSAMIAIQPLLAQVPSTRFAAVQAEREQSSQAAAFALFADAAWAARAAGAGDPNRLRSEAFAALQEAMAGRANQAITRMAVRRFADQAGAGLGALVREREGLESQWESNNRRYGQTFGKTDPSFAEARKLLTQERGEIEARLAAIDGRLRADFPDYFGLTRPEPLAIADAQAMLAADEAFLLVLPTEFGTHLVAVTREEAQWARSDWNTERVHEAVRRLRWDLGASVDAKWGALRGLDGAASAAPSFERSTAHALYRQLVAPVAEKLAGKRSLFIAAGGPLTGLPFSVLVSALPQGSDSDPAALRRTRWLADDFALTHIPSLQSLQLLRRGRGGSSGKADGFAGFGDPLLTGQAEQRGLRRRSGLSASKVLTRRQSRDGAAVADVAALRQLARLPGTAAELNNMRHALRAPAGSVRLAAEATEAAVRSADLSQARILAFATHGLTAGEVGTLTEPGLVFTPPDKATDADDGYLAASEVAALKLDADWVILSACNTATGDGPDAQGLSGLARAFFYAGARNLLASHWPVDDAVAAQMTVRTIALEKGGASRAGALQQAMRETREARPDWAHPAYWAPFTLIGDGGG